MNLPEPDQARVYLLGAAAIVGGGVMGWAAAQGWPDYEPRTREPTPAEEVGVAAAIPVGLYLTGVALNDAIDEYGATHVLLGIAGITGLVSVIAILRN